MAKRVAPIGIKSSAFTSNAHASVHASLRRFLNKPSHTFHACNGESIQSVWDLAEHLKSVDEPTFTHHANHTKNDYASWLRDVHAEHVLADRLLSARNAHHASKIVANHIVSALHESAHR